MTNAFSGKQALLAFGDAGAAACLSGALGELGIKIAGVATSVSEVHAFLLSRECDFVVAGIFLPMLPVDGLEKSIFSLPLYKKPAVLYAAPENAGELMLKAYSPIVTLPASKEDLADILSRIYPVKACERDIQKADTILANMNFDAVPARKYLAYACAVTANDISRARNLKNSIYPALSETFGVKETKIADAMRRLIDKTFLSGDIESQYRLFGSSIDETRGKPTISQLLALVAEMIRTGQTV